MLEKERKSISSALEVMEMNGILDLIVNSKKTMMPTFLSLVFTPVDMLSTLAVPRCFLSATQE